MKNLVKINFRISLLIVFIIFACYLGAMAAEAPKLIGAFFVKGKVGLNWQKGDVAEYSVYRKSADEDYAVIGTSEKNHYFDTDITPGAVYTYKVGITADGAELFSNEKTVTIPGGTSEDFKPPTWSGIRIDREKINLRWDKVPGAMAYNVYRTTTAGSGYEVVGNAQTARYVDAADLEKGTVYYYVLSALNAEFEETDYSEEKSIKYGMSKAEFDSIQVEENKIELVDYKITKLFSIEKAGKTGNMNQPSEVCINSKNAIYINDVLNAKIHCFDIDGNHQFSFGEKTKGKDKDNPPGGTFLIPMSMFIDKNDNIYVGDIDQHCIQVFNADGSFIKNIKPQFEADKEAFRPNSIYVLDDGRIIATDAGNHRFIIMDQDGKVLVSQGKRGGADGEFNFTDGITVVGGNTICIVDVINGRIQEFDLTGKFIRKFGELGQTAGTFGRPKLIAYEDQGLLWISDAMAHNIQGFTLEGEVTSVISSVVDETLDIATPRGILFKDGKLYIVNRLPNRVDVYKIG